MYAKIFCQIFDSSIADDFRLRHFFMDLLVLADRDGCVDMTPSAIAARTRIPLDEVTAMLAKLEQPDPESRTPDEDGRRIERLDEHRTWGWHIVNYDRFRQIASEEQRREKNRDRVANFRQKRQQNPPCNAPVMPGNACNAKQRQTETQIASHTEEAFTEVATPSLEEVKLVAAKSGAPDWLAENWFSEMDAVGWKHKGQPVVKWERLFTRKLKFWESDGRPMQPPARNRTARAGTPRQQRTDPPQLLERRILRHGSNRRITQPGNAHRNLPRVRPGL